MANKIIKFKSLNKIKQFGNHKYNILLFIIFISFSIEKINSDKINKLIYMIQK